MKRTLSLQDWLMLAILIVFVNVGIRLLDKPITADAQDRPAAPVAAAISNDGQTVVIVKSTQYKIIRSSTESGGGW